MGGNLLGRKAKRNSLFWAVSTDTDIGNIEQADSEPDKKVISNQERR
jgi:hypothetical protein